MNDRSSAATRRDRLPLLGAIAAVALTTALAACNKSERTQTTVVPGDTPAATTTATTATTPTAAPAASSSDTAAATSAASGIAGGTVSVIDGPARPAATGDASTLPAPSPSTSASAPTTIGVPPAPGASQPGAASIGPPSDSGIRTDQPPSVSPGTTR